MTNTINLTAQYYIDKIREVCERVNPLVVIHCITYNHEPYLREALEGFIKQKTDFHFVAIVHEDVSTDKTADIIKEYAEKYPNIILPIFENENQYSKGTLGKVMNNACKATGAKYIAICEGDDYWTDPLKLQKQVDFLESHPDYGMCYTKVKRFDQTKNKFLDIWGGPNEKFEDFLHQHNAPTLTTLCRYDIFKNYISSVRPETKNWLIGDFPKTLFFSLHSKIHFIDEVTGVYRILEESASHSKSIDKLIPYLQNIYEIKCYFIDKYNKDEEKDMVEYSHLLDLISFLPNANMEYRIICLKQLKKCKDKLNQTKYFIIKNRIKYKHFNQIYNLLNSIRQKFI